MAQEYGASGLDMPGYGAARGDRHSLPPTHPDSFEVDHLVPVNMGGNLYDRDNIDATHRCFNQWRSNRSVEEVMEIARLRRRQRGWGV
jgi:hypothetical protein